MGAVMETVAIEVRIPKSLFRDPSTYVECCNEKCKRGGRGKRVCYVPIVELVTSPETVPECCGEPMRLPSLDEVDR